MATTARDIDAYAAAIDRDGDTIVPDAIEPDLVRQLDEEQRDPTGMLGAPPSADPMVWDRI